MRQRFLLRVSQTKPGDFLPRCLSIVAQPVLWLSLYSNKNNCSVILLCTLTLLQELLLCFSHFSQFYVAETLSQYLILQLDYMLGQIRLIKKLWEQKDDI